jgi:hypothetical protein
VGDRSEPLHRRAKQPAKRLGFRLAQLRELGGDVRHRAVVLAELLPARRADRGRRASRRGIPVRGQRLGERLHPLGQRLMLRYRGLVPVLQVRHLTAGELGHSLGSRRLSKKPQGARGQVVVGVLEGTPAGIGDNEYLRRPSATPVAVRPRRPGLDQALGNKRVKVPPDGRRSQPEPAAERGGRRRADLQDESRNLTPGAPLRCRRGTGIRDCPRDVFHNASVT